MAPIYSTIPLLYLSLLIEAITKGWYGETVKEIGLMLCCTLIYPEFRNIHHVLCTYH